MKLRFKWFKLFASFTLLWLFLLTLSLYTQPRATRFGVVDMQVLVAQQAKQLVGKHSANVPSQALQAGFTHIKDVLRSYSVEQNIILLSKASVVGGELDDVTFAILEKLEVEP
jgi:hypothetical protein